jgi:hypothetical protein
VEINGAEWTWIAVSNDPTTAESGVYGTLGTHAAANTPGARTPLRGWTRPARSGILAAPDRIRLETQVLMAEEFTLRMSLYESTNFAAQNFCANLR